MNRNTEAHFAELPTVKIGRSKFDRSFNHKTTFNTGELVPVFVDPDIVPGDTVTMRQSELVRMMTPIAPVMDNSFMDFYWFFVPDRLVWDNFKRFMGENDTAPWTQTIDYQIPQLAMDNNSQNETTEKLECTIIKGSVLNHMGIPQQNWVYSDDDAETYKKIQISALPARAYALIWNEFFRDENLQNPLNIPKTDSLAWVTNENTQDYLDDKDEAQVKWAYTGGLPCMKVCKVHDYFTSALPEAQKGPAVALPFSTDLLKVELGPYYNGVTQAGETHYEWADNGATNRVPIFENDNNTLKFTRTAPFDGSEQGKDLQNILASQPMTYGETSLAVDLTKATGATVTALRQAFAIQKFYERDARGGTRYIESVKSHFGVTNPDFRLQRPEYLGGFRQNINMNQVVQSSPLVEDTTTPLGTTGAFSVTTHEDGDVFTHSFTEHGILMGLCCVRTTHTYQQGINRAWFKKNRLDFYSPEFANLSEQAILNQEIYADGSSEDKEAFGYQEAWAEMRYMPDTVSGEISSLYEQSLDVWTYADYYEDRPRLGDKWIQETEENVERTLAIQDHDQFMADFYFGAIYTRPMPLYSIPGLIDHH